MKNKKEYEGLMIISLSMLLLCLLIDFMIPSIHLIIGSFLFGMVFGLAFNKRFLL